MSLIQDLRDENIRAIKVDPEGDKVMRMNAQTARIEAGSVSLPRSASWLDEFRREIMFVATARPAGCHRGEARGRWNRWLCCRAKSEPDGYTLVTSSSSMATEAALHRRLGYDPLSDFIPVVLIGTSPNLLIASRDSGFKTVADLVAADKAKPGALHFASAGISPPQHLAAGLVRH